MFEDLRRSIEHRHETKAKDQLKRLEKERQRSQHRTTQYGERRSAEESLSEQAKTELSAREATRQALRERKQLERELRPGMQKVSKIAKAALYELPIKSLRLGAKSLRLGAKMGKKQNVRGVFFGPTGFVLGPQSKQSIDEFMFGTKSQPAPPKKKKQLGIFEIDKDIFNIP